MIEYLKQHETTIVDLAKQIALRPVWIAKCNAIIKHIEASIKLQNIGYESAVCLPEEIKIEFISDLKQKTGKSYSLDISNEKKIAQELTDLKLFTSNLEKSTEEFKTYLKNYFIEYPPPAEFINQHRSWIMEYL